MLKKILLSVLAVIVLLAAVVLFNTFTFKSIQQKVTALAAPDFSPEALKHFQEAIHFKTISYSDSTKLDSTQFNGFHRFLEKTYPTFHQKTIRQVFKGYSLLYKWEGKNVSLKPYIIMAHQDVVPIEEASRSLWTVDPFEGVVKENFIWGRGTTDDKINLISIMESAEKLIKENFQPEHTIYFVFGHDEEVGGTGAIAIVKWFKENNIEAELVIDEGGIITKEKLPGITKPVALIGNAEKGYFSLELSVELSGGHSSMPANETAIDILTKALVKLRAKPFEPKLSESVQGMMKSLGPEMPFVQKMAFANPWLFKSLIIGTYQKSAASNAMIRTTLVPTIINAGIKDNVIPTVAKATINIRLLPGDKSEVIKEQLKNMIDDDRVKFATLLVNEASNVTPYTGEAFNRVSSTMKQSLPDVLSTPFLMIGATDSRHFQEVSLNIIKFSPMIDPIGFHGIDERVSLESFKTSIFFFENLMRNAK